MSRFSAWVDELMVRERVRNYSWIFVVMGSAALVVNAAFGHLPLTLSGEVVAPDFLAHWTGGRLMLQGQVAELYDPAIQSALQMQSVGATKDLSWFVSPPLTALMFVPFAALPYSWGALAWTGASLALLGWALFLSRPFLRDRQGDHALFVLAIVATPAVLELIGAGQDTAVALIAVTIALRLLRVNHDVLAGAVFAVGLYKPHLFVLVPVALVVLRRYRALSSLAVTSAVLIVLTLPVVGARTWEAWLAALTSPRYDDAVQAGHTSKMQSISALATSLGAPPVVVYPLLLIGAAIFVWRTRTDRDRSGYVWALALMTTVVFSPHAMVYDLVLLVPALAYFLAQGNTAATRLLAVVTCLLLWTVQLRHGLATHFPSWAPLSAPWSALPLLGLWQLLSPSTTRTLPDRFMGSDQAPGRIPVTDI